MSGTVGAAPLLECKYLVHRYCFIPRTDFPSNVATSLEAKDPADAGHGATALHAHIAQDSEFDKKKIKRGEAATALYAYIAHDSEFDEKKAKRNEDATALYAYIVHDSELED